MGTPGLVLLWYKQSNNVGIISHSTNVSKPDIKQKGPLMIRSPEVWVKGLIPNSSEIKQVNRNPILYVQITIPIMNTTMFGKLLAVQKKKCNLCDTKSYLTTTLPIL